MVKHTRNNRSKRNSKCRQKRLSRKMKGSAGILNISKQFLSNITGTPIFLPKLGLDINNLNKAAFYLHAEHANNVGYKTIFISNVSKIISEKARQIYNDEKYSTNPSDPTSKEDPAMIALGIFDYSTVNKILDACCEKLGFVGDKYIQIDINIGKKILLYADRVFDYIHNIETSKRGTVDTHSLNKIIRNAIDAV